MYVMMVKEVFRLLEYLIYNLTMFLGMNIVKVPCKQVYKLRNKCNMGCNSFELAFVGVLEL